VVGIAPEGVLRDGLFLTGGGLLIGIPLAVAVSMLFSTVFVEIGGVDPLVIVIATAVLTIAAAVAGAVPARRAIGVQPIRVLRGDS
jgi:ABC-type antimicrobial peptide transport system permease subunit